MSTGLAGRSGGEPSRPCRPGSEHSPRRAGVVYGLPLVGAVWLAVTAATVARPAAAPTPSAIPAFARMYRTTCSTCHIAAPKLNVLGEAFRLNGYRMPESQLLIRRDDPLPLGDDAWKDEWPRSIWPGEVPGQVPLALRIQTDARLTRDEEARNDLTFRFPNEIYLLAGAPLGSLISAFLETEWSRERGIEVVQAKLGFNDLFPGLPAGAMNLWVGQQNPYLFTFVDRQIDRSARQKFMWQEFSPSDITLSSPSGDEVRSDNTFALGGTYPAIEVNGTPGGRFYYGVGISQGAGQLTTDNNGRTDLYYKVRYKFGGLDLRGAYDPGGAPVTGTGGQLLDRSLTLEHFGYFGAEPVADGKDDEHRSFGVNARALIGRADAGAGYTWSRYDSPWASLAFGRLDVRSVFGKFEYLVYPWLIGSLKVESFRTEFPDGLPALDLAAASGDQDRILPGAVFLIRQNVRGVVEAELYTKHSQADAADVRYPSSVWLRLDVAF